jgi:broad specificity phosphatase PhoE
LSRFLLVRHGNTAANSAERYWGSTDVELGSDGLEAAERLRDHLAAERIDVVYASDLSRASVTADIITTGRGLSVNICPELREIDFGKLEGLKYDDIERLYPNVVRLWMDRSPTLQYPGGESLAAIDARVLKFCQRLDNHQPGQSVLIVAHSAILRTMICYLLGIEVAHRWDFSLHLASLSVVENYPPKGVLALLNDTSYLSGERHV